MILLRQNLLTSQPEPKGWVLERWVKAVHTPAAAALAGIKLPCILMRRGFQSFQGRLGPYT